MSQPIKSTALFSFVIGAALAFSEPVAAALKDVIEPPKQDLGFPTLIQQEQREEIRIAGPAADQTSPAGAGIDECAAHCPNGVGW